MRIKKQTKSGIHLPDKIEIPTLTGRIVAISAQVASDEDYRIKRYDRILFNPKHGIPVDFEGDNRLFVIPIEDVVAVLRKEQGESIRASWDHGIKGEQAGSSSSPGA